MGMRNCKQKNSSFDDTYYIPTYVHCKHAKICPQKIHSGDYFTFTRPLTLSVSLLRSASYYYYYGTQCTETWKKVLHHKYCSPFQGFCSTVFHFMLQILYFSLMNTLVHCAASEQVSCNMKKYLVPSLEQTKFNTNLTSFFQILLMCPF